MLIVRDLGIEIGARRILDPVSFTVGNGEKVGRVGRNGAGKSTLLSVLLGEHPEHLRITVEKAMDLIEKPEDAFTFFKGQAVRNKAAMAAGLMSMPVRLE